MKILLVSDTHGRMDRLFDLSKSLENIDMVIHLGDHYQDALELENKHKFENRKYFYVPGNTDGFFHAVEYSKVIETEFGNIYICHGHRESVHSGLNSLYYQVLANQCIIGCYGHTHIPEYHDFDNVKLLNPGSLSKPRSSQEGSYGIITLDEKGLDYEICYYKDKKEAKAQGGYIRGIINYSDRF